MMRRSVPFRLVLMLCLPLVLAAGAASAQDYDDPGEGPPARCPPGATKVITANMVFSPATVTIDVGDRVCWENADEISHSVKSNGGAFGMPGPSANHWAYTVTSTTRAPFPTTARSTATRAPGCAAR
jgi:plastocyanin